MLRVFSFEFIIARTISFEILYNEFAVAFCCRFFYFYCYYFAVYFLILLLAYFVELCSVAEGRVSAMPSEESSLALMLFEIFGSSL